MHFKGILIDFGGTLAYLDEVENRRYEEALVSTLENHGYEHHLDDISGVLASAYVSSTKGEQKTPEEFWSIALRKLGIPARNVISFS